MLIHHKNYIEIRNIRFLNCGKQHDTNLEGAVSSAIKATIFICNVYSIWMVDVTTENSCGYGIIALNIVGMCLFERIIIHGSNKTLNSFCDGDTLLGGMAILANDDGVFKLQEDGVAIIIIRQCSFFDIQAIWDDTVMYSFEYFISSIISLVLHQINYHIDVCIESTSITNINTPKRPIILISYSMNSTNNVSITNSSITYTNTNYSTFKISKYYDNNFMEANTECKHKLYLTSSQFRYNKAGSVIAVQTINISMQLKNNLFENNIVENTLFTASQTVVPLISGYLNFSSNMASIVFSMDDYVLLDERAVLSFSNNTHHRPKPHQYDNVIVRKMDRLSPDCPFQFTNSADANIIFHSNIGYYRVVYGNSLFGCSWIADFPNREKLLPSEIYSKVIHYDGMDNRSITGWDSSVCLCNDAYQNCLHSKLSNFSVYPGELFSIGLMCLYSSIALYATTNETKFSTIAPSCFLYPRISASPKIDLVFNHCTEINYTISTLKPMCLLLLKTANKQNNVYAFRIHLKNCSLGFALDHNEGVCKCHPKFATSANVLKCDISNEAFQRPAGGWIGNDSNHIIYTNDCRLGYCLQYPSWVQLNDPDRQCLPSRSGIACGKCKSGLSAVFGTSRCENCTNYWLFLFPVFAIAGVLLVLGLFALNLTVVDGDLYGFILMVNSLSTHDTRLFPSTGDFSWTLVSLSNLDLGIEVCFYDGMTAYAATWLRFIFPFYVLLIVVLMSFASRYFKIIERITRKRVIPVIATLYLLSYNKLMLVTFRGLFSNIYYLSINSKQIYWSIDTSIPIFGLQFTLLFIFFLLIFLLLIVPTNILLLSGKTAYRFKIVVRYLKPFLDAYQAPFKENCRHFLGLELAVRGLIFAAVSFAPENTTAFYTALITVYLIYLCLASPFKSRLNLIVYSSYLLYMSAYVTLFVRFYPFNENSKVYRLMFNSICYISFLEFLGIIVVHIYKCNIYHITLFHKFENFVKKCKSKCQLKFSWKRLYTQRQNVNFSSASYENYQEELLALEPNI